MLIEQVMVCLLGALGASLMWLMALPLLQRRADHRADERVRDQLSVSLIAINADKERLQADHAAALRRLEQRAEAGQSRVAALMGENGRQVSRIVLLERDAAATQAETARHAEALADATRAGQEAQARIAAQAEALHDAESLAERHGGNLLFAESRLQAMDSRNNEYRATIAALETRLAGDDHRLRAALSDAARLAGEVTEAKAAMDKATDERDIAQADGSMAAKTRDALKARVDGLTAALASMEQERDAAVAAHARSDQRGTVHAATIAGLGERIATQDAERDTLHRMLDESDARRDALQVERLRLVAERESPIAEPAVPDHPDDRATALRAAVAALAADLVGFATAAGGPVTHEPATRTDAPA